MNPGGNHARDPDRSSLQTAAGQRRMRSEGLLTENRAMTGIQYVTDEKGRKVAVQIDLKKHRQLWEDIEDVLISRSRQHEKRIPISKVKADLIKSGKLPRE
jgi:hypothetical protein